MVELCPPGSNFLQITNMRPMAHPTREVSHTSRPRASADSLGTSARDFHDRPGDHRAARGVLLPSALRASGYYGRPACAGRVTRAAMCGRETGHAARAPRPPWSAMSNGLDAATRSASSPLRGSPDPRCRRPPPGYVTELAAAKFCAKPSGSSHAQP